MTEKGQSIYKSLPTGAVMHVIVNFFRIKLNKQCQNYSERYFFRTWYCSNYWQGDSDCPVKTNCWIPDEKIILWHMDCQWLLYPMVSCCEMWCAHGFWLLCNCLCTVVWCALASMTVPVLVLSFPWCNCLVMFSHWVCHSGTIEELLPWRHTQDDWF